MNRGFIARIYVYLIILVSITIYANSCNIIVLDENRISLLMRVRVQHLLYRPLVHGLRQLLVQLLRVLPLRPLPVLSFLNPLIL